MRSLITVVAVAACAALAAPAVAGSPHFVGTPDVTVTGDTVTASGKIAGLGNETQVHVVVSGEASCINRGGHNPSADNKDSFSAEGDFPVQNGKALFSLTLTATFQPSCTPPMTVAWGPITVADPEHGLSVTVTP